MDIYADLPSAKKSADSTAASSSPSPAPSSSASKGWAHSKFQGMIAKRTATAVSTPPPHTTPVVHCLPDFTIVAVDGDGPWTL